MVSAVSDDGQKNIAVCWNPLRALTTSESSENVKDWAISRQPAKAESPQRLNAIHLYIITKNDILVIMWTKEQKNQWQRKYRKENGNQSTNKYEKTVDGFLVRKYRNMLSRVTGIQKLKAHLYKGKTLLDKEVFYEWSKQNKTFKKLFKEWEKSLYNRKLCPSVDRIDSSKGYTLENMEWVTHSENSRRGSINRNKLKI